MASMSFTSGSWRRQLPVMTWAYGARAVTLPGGMKRKGCDKGRVNLSTYTKYRLFAESGGYCQNPGCLEPLFVDTGSDEIHIGEMAHVVGASQKAARGDSALADHERAHHSNLILLCPTCH